jgi:signal recognition particle subunit SRP54
VFESLSERLQGIFRSLRGQGTLSEAHVDAALREIRLALLEADVHFRVVKQLLERVRAQAIGQDVLKSLSPDQAVLRVVRDEMTALLGGDTPVKIQLSGRPPSVVLMTGLQGSGKTTTTAKLGRWLRDERGRSPYLVPADVYRPAAIEQLGVLARELGVPVHPASAGGDPIAIARSGVQAARERGADTVLVDTAGRQTVDEELMRELEQMAAAVVPQHVLLVADAMTGQDAVTTAQGFAGRLAVSGVVLTKMEGDARGGAALSLRAVTGKPILFAGTGERLDALEAFHPDRIASRILGMGDVLSLIERAERAYDREKAEAFQKKLKKDQFDLEDFR